MYIPSTESFARANRRSNKKSLFGMHRIAFFALVEGEDVITPLYGRILVPSIHVNRLASLRKPHAHAFSVIHGWQCLGFYSSFRLHSLLSLFHVCASHWRRTLLVLDVFSTLGPAPSTLHTPHAQARCSTLPMGSKSMYVVERVCADCYLSNWNRELGHTHGTQQLYFACPFATAPYASFGGIS